MSDSLIRRTPWPDSAARPLGTPLQPSVAYAAESPDALDAQTAAEYLGEVVALVVDGGRAAGGIPSTVVDSTVEPPIVLREGAIPATAIGDTVNGAHS